MNLRLLLLPYDIIRSHKLTVHLRHRWKVHPAGLKELIRHLFNFALNMNSFGNLQIVRLRFFLIVVILVSFVLSGTQPQRYVVFDRLSIRVHSVFVTSLIVLPEITGQTIGRLKVAKTLSHPLSISVVWNLHVLLVHFFIVERMVADIFLIFDCIHSRIV